MTNSQEKVLDLIDLGVRKLMRSTPIDMKIVADRNIPFLEGRIEGAELVRMPAAEIDREAARDADALIVRTRTRCDASLLEGSRVRTVATATIGTDHIDIPWCESHGIAVRNAPGCNAPGVALYVWASLLRNGFDPEKDTLGVIGHGHVGSIVAQWGKRLGARVLVNDPPREEAGYKDAEYVTLEEVLTRSNAITLHTPLTREGKYPTFHLIGEGEIGMMRNGAVLVNAARGEVIDTASVVKAIKDGKIGKAIIDTWEGEPKLDPELLGLSDVATPHIAGYSVEGKQRATRMALEAVGESLGITVNVSGLAGPYREPSEMEVNSIAAAYDPTEMTAALKASPSEFERLRNGYGLHKELC